MTNNVKEVHTHKEHEHAHDHAQEHGGHDHDHGSMPAILFFIGLAAFLVASFIPLPLFWERILHVAAMVLAGSHVIEEGILDTINKTKEKGKFTPNVHILMTLAAIGAMIIGDFAEGSLLIVIFAGAHFLEDYAEGKSKREITNLLNMNPTEARLLKADGTVEIVDVTQLKIGDQLQVLNGDQVPTDGVVLSGHSSIDESSINGESIPREKVAGDDVFGSTINGNGVFTMEVTKDSSDTIFAKIIELVNQSQSNLSKRATKIQTLEPYYVNAVLIIVPLFILTTPFLLGWDWYTSFYRGMVFLTVASPCALAASSVPATLSGISNLAKKGVLFKGGSFLANLADIKSVAFDKTGTLTEGKPVVTDFYFLDEKNQDTYLDIIIAMEKTANHPLAEAILSSFPDHDKAGLDIEVENIIGQGLTSIVDGDTYIIGKPEQFIDANDQIDTHNATYSNEGKTVVYFAKNNKVLGMIAMMDVPNKNAVNAISYLKSQNIHTVMITGDAKKTGEAVGRQIGIDEVIGNVLPENKAKIIEDQQTRYGVSAMLGDGINDAPALVKADIGFAMGDGTDIAIDVADAVIMNNDLTKFSYAHRISKKLDKVTMQNIIFSMGVVALLVVLNILGKMNLPLGVIVHEGSTLVVILNGLRMLRPLKE